MAQPRVTVATLAAILERIEKTLNDFVLKELYQSELKQLNTRISQLESKHEWITRLVIGAVAMAVLASVIGVSQGIHP